MVTFLIFVFIFAALDIGSISHKILVFLAFSVMINN